jgi:hypothetical protein
VIGINKGHAPVRRRFTLAHELGHVLLTAHDDLHIDHSFYDETLGAAPAATGEKSRRTASQLSYYSRSRS